MKKILLIGALVFLISCAKMPASQSSKGLLFQISESTGRLLVNGDPFQESSATFWKMWPGACSFHCNSEKVIIINYIRSPRREVEYGTSVFVRSTEDFFWYQSVFVPREEIDSLGGIVKITGTNEKINFLFKNASREYDRMDK